MNSVSAIVKPMSATMRAKSNAGPSPVLPAETPVRLDAKADTRVVTDEFLIQNLGPRRREAFKTLIGRAVPEEQVTAAFDDTLSQQDDDLSLCLVAETHAGALLGLARAHGPVDIDEDAVLISSQIAVLDLLIASSETVGDALLIQLAGSVDQIGCGRPMASFSTQTA
ncbi:hypothetical protein SAMN05216282_1068 [Cryobacterium psychrotolerans]|uniref:Uncharacterized protein n=1 Tax=Cryobacterium psychrotolerans TaxID=386301 RepID=A0A1G9BS24_9MICO|nr:hypothetical protein [Cryobacterium psychrotolerans]TFD84073.1 hypothetical protein E3T56_10155 [Cryobacterium psychrotolerans]SDK42291.1 hypothetical protein SAMN05216282_1068 [Cryobacterium psychrotolerans]